MNTDIKTANPSELDTVMPRRHDPILQELWDTKAKMNAEANYDVHTLFESAKRAAAPYFDANGRVKIVGAGL